MFDDVSGVARPNGGSQPWEPPSLLEDELDGVMPAEGGLNLSLDAIENGAKDFGFKPVDEMNPEALHLYLHQMKEHYEKVVQHNRMLEEKLHR